MRLPRNGFKRIQLVYPYTDYSACLISHVDQCENFISYMPAKIKIFLIKMFLKIKNVYFCTRFEYLFKKIDFDDRLVLNR
jgi:hypothetical protein